MIAALPMYDRQETAGVNDRLWSLVREQLGYGPDQLNRQDDLWEIWQSPDLVLAQTCGYPLRARLWPNVQLVASPVWDLQDCPAGYYCSVIIARAGGPDPREMEDPVFAYNEPLSQSGWAGPRVWADRAGHRLGRLAQTGAHRASAQAVAEGRADWAGIDIVTWALLRRYERFCDDLNVIALTDPTPALPFICAKGLPADEIFGALEHGVSQLSESEREILCLKGITKIPIESYLSVVSPAAPDQH